MAVYKTTNNGDRHIVITNDFVFLSQNHPVQHRVYQERYAEKYAPRQVRVLTIHPALWPDVHARLCPAGTPKRVRNEGAVASGGFIPNQGGSNFCADYDIKVSTKDLAYLFEISKEIDNGSHN